MKLSLRFTATLSVNFIVGFLLSITASAATSSRRQLTQNVTWQSCNQYQICYRLKAQEVDIGILANRYYASPIDIQIFKKRTNGILQPLRQIQAKEGQWNYERNQWLLTLTDSKHKDREYLFIPDRLQH